VPARAELRSEDGRLVATYETWAREGLPRAEDVWGAPGAGPAVIAAAAMRALPGHVVAGPPGLGEALIAAGAAPRRRALLMTRDLRAAVPPAPAGIPGFALVPATADMAQALGEAAVAAYPAGHPDHDPERSEEDEREALRRVMAGEAVGPLLPASVAARREDGALAGAALVCRMPGEPPHGGPWVADLFRDPAAPRGLGAALLAEAMRRCAAQGHEVLGLVVTLGNPAVALYERLGFTVAREVLSVLIPGEAP
jgi:GNAT superfamily N-acetyltransferase